MLPPRRHGPGRLLAAPAKGETLEGSRLPVAAEIPRHRENGSTRVRLLLLAAAATAIACLTPRTPPPANLNVLLISLDTLRADHLGMYGHRNATSPALDAFAAGAVVFEQAVAPSSWTLPSHMTMLTGLHPLSHGVHDQQHMLRAEIPTLAETLAARGYRTFAMTGGGYVEKRRFERGFAEFRTSREPFASVLKIARDWIGKAGADKPWFVFLHTYDIHCPYSPPEPYRSMFVEAGAEPLSPPMLGSHAMELCRQYKDLDDDQVRYMSGLYDGDIRWVDDALAPFLEYLESAGLRDRTVVVLTSDHGEEFFEHGGTDHGRTLFREQLMVPLIVAAPGASPRRVGGLVGLEDIVPTALELAGQPALAGLDGRSLAPWIRGQPGDAPTDPRVSTLLKNRPEKNYRTSSWLDERHHLVDDREMDKRWLFDAAGDPAESRDRAGDEPAAVAGLQARLLEYERRFTEKPEARIETTPPPAEELERLKSLGYINN